MGRTTRARPGVRTARKRYGKGAYMHLKSADNLRIVMADQGLSVAELAMYAACSKSFIGHLLTGYKKSCTTELGQRIARALKMPVEFLFDVRVSPSTGTENSQQKAAA